MQNFQGVEYLTVLYAEERLTHMDLPSSFFCGQFSLLDNKKKGGATFTTEFWKKRGPNSPDFEERNLILPVLDYRFQPIARISQHS
jgi:hypothetical protein